MRKGNSAKIKRQIVAAKNIHNQLNNIFEKVKQLRKEKKELEPTNSKCKQNTEKRKEIQDRIDVLFAQIEKLNLSLPAKIERERELTRINPFDLNLFANMED